MHSWIAIPLPLPPEIREAQLNCTEHHTHTKQDCQYFAAGQPSPFTKHASIVAHLSVVLQTERSKLERITCTDAEILPPPNQQVLDFG